MTAVRKFQTRSPRRATCGLVGLSARRSRAASGPRIHAQNPSNPTVRWREMADPKSRTARSRLAASFTVFGQRALLPIASDITIVVLCYKVLRARQCIAPCQPARIWTRVRYASGGRVRPLSSAIVNQPGLWHFGDLGKLHIELQIDCLELAALFQTHLLMSAQVACVDRPFAVE